MSRLQFTIARWSFHINLHEYSIQHYLILVPGTGVLPNTSATHWNISEHLKKRLLSQIITVDHQAFHFFPYLPTHHLEELEDQFEARCVSESWAPPLPPTSHLLSSGPNINLCHLQATGHAPRVNGFSQFTSSYPYICMPWRSSDTGQTSTCAIAELSPLFWLALDRTKTSCEV